MLHPAFVELLDIGIGEEPRVRVVGCHIGTDVEECDVAHEIIGALAVGPYDYVTLRAHHEEVVLLV